MIINDNTWPTIEAKFNKIYEKEKIKQQESKVLGQKPVNYKGRKEKSFNKRS